MVFIDRRSHVNVAPCVYNEFYMKEKNSGWRFLEELVLNESFLKEVDEIRKQNEFAQAVAGPYLLKKYAIPTKFGEVIANYIETNELHPELTSSKVRVVSDRDHTIEPSEDPKGEWRALNSLPQTAVSLRLSFDLQKTELINFIKDNWDELIKPRLLNNTSPRRGVRDPEGDRLIYEEYLNRKASNMRAIDIAMKYEISEQQLYRIINRQKNKP